MRGYGRDGDPAAPEYNFERRVDFCSGGSAVDAAASLFDQLGGFDERYRPAYYDDADYCARVWAVRPFGRVSAEGCRDSLRVRQRIVREASIELQRSRRPIFVSTSLERLAEHSQMTEGGGGSKSRNCSRRVPTRTGSPSVVVHRRRGARSAEWVLDFHGPRRLMRRLADLGYPSRST